MRKCGKGIFGTDIDTLAFIEIVGTSEVELAVRPNQNVASLTSRAVVVGSTHTGGASSGAQDTGTVGAEEVPSQANALVDIEGSVHGTVAITSRAVGTCWTVASETSRFARSAS